MTEDEKNALIQNYLKKIAKMIEKKRPKEEIDFLREKIAELQSEEKKENV